MLTRSVASAATLLLALTATNTPAQCPPVTTLAGFNQQRLGRSVAADSGFAIVGQTRGYRADILQLLPDGTTRLVARLGGSSNPSSMGFATAMTGRTVAAGDPRNSTRPALGAVTIGERSGAAWRDVTTFYPPATGGGEQLGSAVAISDDERWVAAGAPFENGGGAVYLYTRSTSGFSYHSKLRAAHPTTAAFGSTLASAGHRLFVGASREDNNRGATYVFELRSGNWTQIARLTAPGGAVGDQFGAAITADATRVLISAPWRSVGTHSAAGEVFEYTNGSSWTPVRRLRSRAPTAGQVFGTALDVQGGRLAIGGRSHAEVLTATTNGWQRIAAYGRPNPSDSSRSFGNAVALHDSGVMIADWQFDINGTGYPHSIGAVHHYDLVGHDQPLDACQQAIGGGRRDRVALRLRAPGQAGRTYLILGSLTGLGPITVHGVRIPLTYDAYMGITVAYPTTPLLAHGTGRLNGQGVANAEFTVPAPLRTVAHGAQFHHAFVTFDARGALAMASNPVTISVTR